MSVQNRINAAKRLVNILKRWPDDTHKVYNSFRNAQLQIYQSDKPSMLPLSETLELRAVAANELLNDTHAKAFKPNDRIFYPDGNPMYYQLIIREANGQRAKSSIVTGIRNTLFGWWRK